MKRRMPAEGGQGPLFTLRISINLNPHGKGIPSLHLNPLLRSAGMTNEVNLDLQAETTKPDVAVNQEAAPTLSHRKGLHLEDDQHLIPGGRGDHIQPTGDHLIEGEDLHFILHAGSLDRDKGPRAEVDTPILFS